MFSFIIIVKAPTLRYQRLRFSRATRLGAQELVDDLYLTGAIGLTVWRNIANVLSVAGANDSIECDASCGCCAK